jgi:hypothetical protein
MLATGTMEGVRAECAWYFSHLHCSADASHNVASHCIALHQILRRPVGTRAPPSLPLISMPNLPLHLRNSNFHHR